jgi:NAD(P)-dependent dehydrogenase (short-subunit alcohol dehydrogenase family)
MEYYRDKTILITGAFGGFGLCFISQLLDGGASLILCDAPERAIPMCDIEKRLPVPVSGREKQILSVIGADLSNAEGCKTLHEEYRKLGKGLDMIIHNAGIAFGGEYVDIPPELNEKII